MRCIQANLWTPWYRVQCFEKSHTKQTVNTFKETFSM